MTDQQEHIELSNREMAERLGVHFSHVSRMRNGKRYPSRETMQRAAHAFDLTDAEVASWAKAIHEDGAEGSAEWMRANLHD